IFQSLFMKRMMGGTYWENVRNTFLPEFISMNGMMAGMAPTMTFLMMGRDMRAMDPTELLFWGVMSIGVIVGFAVAYPVNVWLVSRGLKHDLMTERDGAVRHGAHAMADAGSHGHMDHAHSGPHGLPIVTRTQLAAVAGFTTLMLAAGMTVPSLFVNMRLGADDV